MALLNKLLDKGSSLSKYNGGPGFVNPLSRKTSAMHAKEIQYFSKTLGTKPGYSMDAAFEAEVNAAFQQYDDGVTNFLPAPTLLDVNNGFNPVSPLSAPGVSPINNTFALGEYEFQFTYLS